MHSAMGLNGDQDCEEISEQFEEDLVLADEFTMSDMWLSWAFFRHIKKGTRLVLIGNVNQLPKLGFCHGLYRSLDQGLNWKFFKNIPVTRD